MLARKPSYNYVLLGLVLFVFPVILLILLTKKLLKKRRADKQEAEAGYKLEPWHQAAAGQQQSGPTVPTVATHATGPYPPRADLGPQQNAREYV